ncbi:MAG: hypothetical protein HGA45_02070 [Chloroflexales bacterium]|nr:hypothetical protein [Chloroflexales bacterium]
MTHNEPTIASILRHLAGEYDGPVDERRVLERVLEQRPSSAKNPYATIRERLRWDGLTLGWLRLSRSQLVPLRVALQGLRFRCLPRVRDLEAGLLPMAHLQPFAGLRSGECVMRDAAGARITYLDLDAESARDAALPAFDLRAFYARTAFRPGDSVVVTVTSAEPLVLLVEREARDEFRAGAVADQDAELLEAVVERVRRSQAALVPCDEVVLPVFATAPWRAAYPGSPWQHLVMNDGRLQLVDDIFLTSQRFASLHLFGSDEVFDAGQRAEHDHNSADAALLAEIDALQHDLGRARKIDAEAGLWSGQVQRASAAYGGLDDDLVHRPFFGGLGDMADGTWEVDEPWDAGAALAEDEVDPTDPATLQAARDRLFELIPSGDADRLRTARPEDAELIIAGHLNMLLARAPELFPRIDIIPPDEVERAGLDIALSGEWQDVWEDDEVDDLNDDLEDEESSDAFAASGDLIGQFYDYLLEMGKSEATARIRARALNIYADFLASYYGRSLAEGDYATLDECLFYFYPRRVMNSSARQVRDICTAIKQLYAFLRQRGVVADDRFAVALWSRRGQAARVVEIYERISRESPSFELLFERLFLPYTES